LALLTLTECQAGILCTFPLARLIWPRPAREEPGSLSTIVLFPDGYTLPNACVVHLIPRRKITMGKLAIWAQLEAKPGKEQEVEKFLKSAQPLAEKEPGTITWYAVKLGPSRYGIFDTFADESGRNAHLNGEIAKALFAKAQDLFAKPPEIAKPEILASKSGRG
jgi:quinol monooxygenase YgiN